MTPAPTPRTLPLIKALRFIYVYAEPHHKKKLLETEEMFYQMERELAEAKETVDLQEQEISRVKLQLQQKHEAESLPKLEAEISGMKVALEGLSLIDSNMKLAKEVDQLRAELAAAQQETSQWRAVAEDVVTCLRAAIPMPGTEAATFAALANFNQLKGQK